MLQRKTRRLFSPSLFHFLTLVRWSFRLIGLLCFWKILRKKKINLISILLNLEGGKLVFFVIVFAYLCLMSSAPMREGWSIYTIWLLSNRLHCWQTILILSRLIWQFFIIDFRPKFLNHSLKKFYILPKKQILGIK